MSARYAGDRTTGFASPASDAIEGPIDLSQTLDLKNPSRYPVRVRGATFAARGILDGDILIAKDFRNLIHPGRAQRLGQVCDRATALTALAAVESIARDLSKSPEG
ncbi:MAG: hypothetical protein LKI99_04780 [Acetobacter fabarum]|jgi:hypothetical protein|nr:hypothetical protein [Acetobacter fabarum]MCI1927857.1 hypothetical protein [Acetobacter fabarum]MCI1947874.1 hypothetical protein [Acetobacter fabarum]MCI1988865.1 hypothetical protein [Acetobacter fabarum]MCI2024311.1 hypothetical protein [Acetobacter fabarum]